MCSSSGSFGVEVARRGERADAVWTGDAIAGTEHPIPPDASADGCRLARHAHDPGGRRLAVRLLRRDAPLGRGTSGRVLRGPTAAPASRILLVLSTATYNAYNDWGGPSLYTGGTRVSFERPLARGFLARPEPAVRKAQAMPDREALGLLRVGGGTGAVAVERRFGLVDLGAAVRRVGRTRGLRDRRRGLPGSGGAPGGPRWPSRSSCRSATTSTGRGGCATRWSRSSPAEATRRSSAATRAGGRSGSRTDLRAMACFKYRAAEDPVLGTPDERFLTGAWPDRRIGRPEAAMTGLSFSRGGYSRYGLGVPRASRRVHGLASRPLGVRGDGSSLRRRARAFADAIVGYEVDGCDLTIGGWSPGADARRRSARHLGGTGDGAGPIVVAGRAAHPVRERARRARTRGRGPVGELADGTCTRSQHNNAVVGCFDRSRRRDRLQRRLHGLDVRDRGRRPGRAPASRATCWNDCPPDAVGSERALGGVRRGVPADRRPGGGAVPPPGAVHARHRSRRRLSEDQPVRARLRGGSAVPRHDVAEPEGARPPAGSHGACCTAAPPTGWGPKGDAKIYARATDVQVPAIRQAYREAVKARIDWAPDEPSFHAFSIDVHAAGFISFAEPKTVIAWDQARGTRTLPFPDGE